MTILVINRESPFRIANAVKLADWTREIDRQRNVYFGVRTKLLTNRVTFTNGTGVREMKAPQQYRQNVLLSPGGHHGHVFALPHPSTSTWLVAITFPYHLEDDLGVRFNVLKST